MIVKQRKLLCRMNFLRENLLELFGSSLLDGLGNLAGAGGVADFAGLLVGSSVVDSVGELVLELGRGLRYNISMDMSKEGRRVEVCTFSWILPGTEESVAWETPWPRSFCMLMYVVGLLWFE
jgi:hypothetical protein